MEENELAWDWWFCPKHGIVPSAFGTNFLEDCILLYGYGSEDTGEGVIQSIFWLH